MPPDPAPDYTKLSRKGKEPSLRDQRDLTQPAALLDRIVAAQRRTTRRVEKVATPRPPSPPRVLHLEKPMTPGPSGSASTSRPPPVSPRRLPPLPHVVASRNTEDADPEDFSRRLKISNSNPRSPSSKAHGPKLFNHITDSIPMRRTAEPESMSDNTSSSYVPRGTGATPNPQQRDGSSRQLYDHRKDDPVRFSVSVLARPHGRQPPTPKSSAEYVSASSTSSYAASSTFTLSSNTDSSASSALFERPGQTKEDPGNNVFAIQLKKLYRAITALELKIKQEDSEDVAEEGRVLLKGKEVEDEEKQRQKWKTQIADHKRLAEIIHNLLEISLAPSVPASLRNIPTKYNIIIRLWTYAFHKLLESLRRASFTSPLALEHLQDFIYYAYTFYTGLLEEPTLNPFKSGWLEALGDLARYRMAVAAMVMNSTDSGMALTAAAISKASDDEANTSSKPGSDKSISEAPRIDDSPSPSVGLAAARLLEVEPEKERWREIARDWYGSGLTDTPGTGKLHHHLGLLSREVEGEELRGVYHFVKSMTTLHPFSTSRESVLPMWSATAQARRVQPDARVRDLFVLLHGMLFTNIQLDDFQPTLGRFVERLEIEGAEEREWLMMAVINIAAVLEYGKPGGVLKKSGGVGVREGTGGGIAMRMMARRGALDEERMDVDDENASANQGSPPISEVSPNSTPDYPTSFKYTLQLTFAMLSHVLKRPTRKASPFARPTLNPYLTVILTFLTTVLKHPATLEALERGIPWDELAAFFTTIPRSIMASQGLDTRNQSERWVMLTSGCAPPLPEDWSLRGMEWVGRKVFERGFWKSGEERRAEIEILDQSEGGDLTDGIIEDEHDEDDTPSGNSGGIGSEMGRRWVRIARSAVGIADAVEGFNWEAGTREWKVEGKLEEKVHLWKEQDRIEKENEEKRRMGRRWVDDSMDVDDQDLTDDDTSEESEFDDDDSEEVKVLKARRKYLRNLLQSGQRTPPSSPIRRPRPRGAHKAAPARPALNIVAGYTILVVDTNILLSSLSMFASIIESLRWTVVVPLPVIMELDGLASNAAQLGEAAQEAMSYISSHVRSHSMSLKVQTSKGNYLTSLSVRTEQVDFDPKSWDRNMDDLILKAAIWQDEHWVDRSAMLTNETVSKDTANAVRVVLLSLDRNLRLKARSRQLPAASEKDLASILSSYPS